MPSFQATGCVIGLSPPVLSLPSLSQRNTPLTLPDGCTLTFAGHNRLDEDCGPAGSASSDAGQAQNREKNNFCATADPIDLVVENFRALQQATDDANLREGRSLPADRTPLRTIHQTDDGQTLREGVLVRFVEFIDRAGYANVNRGESVNCKFRGEEGNDIHIELGEVSDPDRCDRITAEISPHFRPESWTEDQLEQVEREGLPVRVTGPLFFDASHSPCRDSEGFRASIWEIHPVYLVEVCNTKQASRCRSSSAPRWTPLSDWNPFERDHHDD